MLDTYTDNCDPMTDTAILNPRTGISNFTCLIALEAFYLAKYRLAQVYHYASGERDIFEDSANDDVTPQHVPLALVLQ